MATKRCRNGHYYDDMKHPTCPYCGIADDSSRTMPIANMGGYDNSYAFGGVTVPATAPIYDPGAVTVPNGATYMAQQPAADEGKTVGFMSKKTGIDPVVGWLVCINGASKGIDYRIKAEKNFIGRDKSNDIVIENDNSISREKHAIISYNPKSSVYVIMPGDGRGLVYLNGEEVFAATELKAGDRIELGDTTLYFVPLCGEMFKW